jgi:hypothetical protein
VSYVALEKIHLPVVNSDGVVTGIVEKQAGNSITKAELAAGKQTDDQVKVLLDHGSMCTPEEYETKAAELKAAQAAAGAGAAATSALHTLGFSDDDIAKTLAKKGGAS